MRTKCQECGQEVRPSKTAKLLGEIAKQEGTSGSQLARDYGLTQSYVNKLLMIYRQTDSEVFDNWCKAERPIAVNRMWLISKLPTVNEQKRFYAMEVNYHGKCA